MQRAWMPVILILGLLGPFNEHGLSEKAWAAARPLGGALLPEQRGSLDFDPRLEKDYEKLIPDQAHLMGEGEDEDLPAFESKDEAAGLTNSVCRIPPSKFDSCVFNARLPDSVFAYHHLNPNNNKMQSTIPQPVVAIATPTFG